jgi:hypothetical protein
VACVAVSDRVGTMGQVRRESLQFGGKLLIAVVDRRSIRVNGLPPFLER